MIRPDLDGLFARDASDDIVWLVFHGKRHRIASSEVMQALFDSGPEKSFDLTPIKEGKPLDFGTCLARSGPSSSIFLVRENSVGVEKNLIPSYENFLEFGFSLQKVIWIPEAVLDLVSLGRDLTGAACRFRGA